MSEGQLELLPIDIGAFRRGNTGIDYVHRFAGERPGPVVMINALTHGNEVCGAHTLAWLFEREIRPARGTLILSFANVAAYQRFDEGNPTASRFVDEDMNRLWNDDILFGERSSAEIRRARELHPFVSTADYLLDIHSMTAESPPMMLCGTAPRGRELASQIGVPQYIVADRGHSAGPRMRDYDAFARHDGEKTALLVECGQHWRQASAEVALDTALRFLKVTGCVDPASIDAHLKLPTAPQRQIEVSGPVTIESDAFRFTRPFDGFEVIERAGTVIGFDSAMPIATPYDDCILIMPARLTRRGQTAVRFGRFVD